jgi:hypothetical protein
MSDYATNQASSPAAAVGARSSASTWQPCTTVYSALAAKQAIRVRMHDGNGFLTARRLKERSSP